MTVIQLIQSSGDSLNPALAAMAGAMFLLPVVGVIIRRTFRAVKGNS